MLESLLDSDGEMGYEPINSSSTSSSSLSSCSGISLSPETAASTSSRLSLSATKPHLSSSDPLFSSLRSRSLGPRDFTLIRRLGRGDIGTVFLCRLSHPAAPDGDGGARNPLLFAMKVVDKREAEKKNKLFRAETEKRILRSLDHPFLPTLYADFDASPHYSCAVMEFCPGGDLHALRHRQPSKRFPATAARFYAAEVLVALEYLHLLGVVYRDLKPENVLLRRDGHVMLSDFDLSLLSTSDPSLHSDPPPPPSCFPTRVFSKRRSSRRQQRLVAEPVAARSGSFVGTHEYVAPEVAAGKTHGAAVDWWAFGVFLYELVHGRTPFAGKTNEDTLRNIVKKPVLFPTSAPPAQHVDPKLNDLIAKLLDKEPSHRLGATGGAADVKGHPYFAGVNFALLRSQKPPFVPSVRSSATASRRKPDRFEYF